MYQFKRVQLIKTDMDTCWTFFSSPANLSRITPKYMGFDILTDVPQEMYEGMIISYTVRPLFGIPMNWVTEITHIKDRKFFVDEQRKGPYRIWHHEHHFKETENGIEMTDIVSYELPLGILGKSVHPFIVKNKLKEIFDYRYRAVEEIFP